jgi:hypothetical protein
MHGVLLLPEAIPLPELASVEEEIDWLAGEIFAFCQSPSLNVEGLSKFDASIPSRWPSPS